MAIASTYNTGTASISANSTAVTGQGTTWLTSGLQAGDLFTAAGLSVRIASVNSNTSITLAYPWPGTTRATDTYEVRFTPDATRILASARQLIDMLGNGNVASIAALTSAANKLPYFTGAGAAALADFTAHARAITALSGGNGKFIRSTGAGTAVMQDILGVVAQVGGVPTGSIVERGSNANGEYVRFSDGTQICTAKLTADYTGVNSSSSRLTKSWSYPATFAAPGAAFIGVSPPMGSGAPFVGISGGNQGRESVKSAGGTNSTSVFGTEISIWFVAGTVSTTNGSVADVQCIAVGRWF